METVIKSISIDEDSSINVRLETTTKVEGETIKVRSTSKHIESVKIKEAYDMFLIEVNKHI